ncbi:hypothetical protein HDU80_010110 [Chytriomyces hyalinus]|nr:hypothetical protein HDU80_010110 [Chytriomyces hyalinus]
MPAFSVVSTPFNALAVIQPEDIFFYTIKEDFRSRPKGPIADLVIDVATVPSLETVPVQTAFQIADMIKAYYHEPRCKVGAAEAVKAINLKLQSDSAVRVHHCLTLLDILLKSCGPLFAETVIQIGSIACYKNILEPSKYTKITHDCRVRFLDILAEWAASDVQGAYPVLHQFVAEMYKSGYPFSKAAIEKIIPFYATYNANFFKFRSYADALEKANKKSWFS